MIELTPEYCQITEGYDHFLKHIKEAKEIIEKMEKVVEGVQYENLQTNMELFGLIEDLGTALYSGMEESLDGWNVPDTDDHAKEYVNSLRYCPDRLTTDVSIDF